MKYKLMLFISPNNSEPRFQSLEGTEGRELNLAQ